MDLTKDCCEKASCAAVQPRVDSGYRYSRRAGTGTGEGTGVQPRVGTAAKSAQRRQKSSTRTTKVRNNKMMLLKIECHSSLCFFQQKKNEICRFQSEI